MGPSTRAMVGPRAARGRTCNVPTVRPTGNQPRFGNINPVLAEGGIDPIDEARQLRALYDKHLEDVGLAQDKDTERYVLQNYVYDTIWSLKKFVAGEHEMEATGMIAILVFEGVNVDKDKRLEYWKRNRGYVVDCINMKRSNTSGSIKREFISK
jgi:hypothetical protein